MMIWQIFFNIEIVEFVGEFESFISSMFGGYECGCWEDYFEGIRIMLFLLCDFDVRLGVLVVNLEFMVNFGMLIYVWNFCGVWCRKVV